MTVLVIRKPTNLEQHGELVRSQAASGGLDSSQIDILSESHDEHYECVEAVRQQLSELEIPFVEMQRGDVRPSGKFDAIISVGGDGTLLSASHSIEDKTPVIGFRSSDASVGYLCAGAVSDVPRVLKAYKEGELVYQERHRIRALVFQAENRSQVRTFPVLNDFLYTNSNPASTTRYRISFNGKVETQKSSGLWLSTATGSTAAISAAGGQVLDATDERLQFVVRELYLFDGLNNQISAGFLQNDEQGLEIENHCASGILALDGERGVIRLKFGDRIKFERALPIRVAKSPNS